MENTVSIPIKGERISESARNLRDKAAERVGEARETAKDYGMC